MISLENEPLSTMNSVLFGCANGVLKCYTDPESAICAGLA